MRPAMNWACTFIPGAVDLLSAELDASQHRVTVLTVRVAVQEAEIRKMRDTLGWCFLSAYRKIKRRYFWPIYWRLIPNGAPKE